MASAKPLQPSRPGPLASQSHPSPSTGCHHKRIVGFWNVCAEKVGQTNGQTAGEDLKRPTNQGNEISFISAYFLFFFPTIQWNEAHKQTSRSGECSEKCSPEGLRLLNHPTIVWHGAPTWFIIWLSVWGCLYSKLKILNILKAIKAIDHHAFCFQERRRLKISISISSWNTVLKHPISRSLLKSKTYFQFLC